MVNMKKVEDQLLPISSTCQSIKQENMNSTSVRHSKFAELLRRSTSNQLQCSMFCGGRKCKYEIGSVWDKKDKAIPIIYSHWITDDILAMSRPNTEMIQHFNLIGLFKKQNIQTIINLQEPGEHANCGPPLEDDGFSYNPKTFMDNNIYFYNFQWRDFMDISEDLLADMVKVITFALLQGKVAIHCHAGLGRTGTLIAAYLIYTYRCQAQNAINFVRSRRSNSIQSRSQILILFKFVNYISPCFIVYSRVSSSIHISKTTLKEFLQRQNRLLHGEELRILRFIPKIVFIICEKLIQLTTFSIHQPLKKDELENFTYNYLSYESYDQIEILIKTIDKNCLQSDLNSESLPELSSNSKSDLQNDPDSVEKLIESLVDGNTSTDTLHDVLEQSKFLEHRDNLSLKTDSSLVSDRNQISKRLIIQTLIDQPKIDHELADRIYDYQQEINNKPNGWDRLRKEKDAEMLCALLLNWLENFDIPILNNRILAKIVDSKQNFMKCFCGLDQETRYTVEYLARFLIKISNDCINDDHLKERLLMRFIASLTMRKIKLAPNEIIPHLPKSTWAFLDNNLIILDFFNELMKVIIIHDQRHFKTLRS